MQTSVGSRTSQALNLILPSAVMTSVTPNLISPFRSDTYAPDVGSSIRRLTWRSLHLLMNPRPISPSPFFEAEPSLNAFTVSLILILTDEWVY